MFWAAEGRARFEWGQTSTLLAMIRNVNRAKNSRAVKPSELSPFSDEHKVTIESLSDLRGYFVDEKELPMDSGNGITDSNTCKPCQGTESEDAH